MKNFTTIIIVLIALIVIVVVVAVKKNSGESESDEDDPLADLIKQTIAGINGPQPTSINGFATDAQGRRACKSSGWNFGRCRELHPDWPVID